MWYMDIPVHPVCLGGGNSETPVAKKIWAARPRPDLAKFIERGEAPTLYIIPKVEGMYVEFFERDLGRIGGGGVRRG